MAVDEWAVTFGTVRRGLGGAAAHTIVYAGPHRWKHQMNEADGGRHLRQAGSHQTTSEVLV